MSCSRHSSAGKNWAAHPLERLSGTGSGPRLTFAAPLRQRCTLESAHGNGSLYPQDLRTRFDAERWMDWQQTTLNPAGRNAFVQLLRTPAEKRQPKLVDDSIAATEPLLRVLDGHLAAQPFMAVSFVVSKCRNACVSAV